MTFTYFLIVSIVGVAGYIGLYFYLARRNGAIQLPFLMSVIVLVWLAPQLFNLVSDDLVESDELRVFAIAALTALMASYLGWIASRAGAIVLPRSVYKSKIQGVLNSPNKIDLQKLSIFFVLVANAIQFLILSQPPEDLVSTQPSGLITILYFFSTLNPIAFTLALVSFLHRRSFSTFVILFLASANYFVPIFVNFKRNELIELGVSIGIVLWVMRGIQIPKMLFPVLMIAGFIVIFGVVEIRNRIGFQMSDDGNLISETLNWSDVAEIDWTEAVSKGFNEQSNEALNGILTISDIKDSRGHTFGANFYNGFVDRWVPGQFVGHELKQSLFVQSYSVQEALASKGVRWKLGTTSTGLTDSYGDFNHVGAVVFFLCSFVAGRMFVLLMNGSIAALAIYPSIVVLCIVGFTHSAYELFYLAPFLYFSYKLVDFGLSGARRYRSTRLLNRGPNQNTRKMYI